MAVPRLVRESGRGLGQIGSKLSGLDKQAKVRSPRNAGMSEESEAGSWIPSLPHFSLVAPPSLWASVVSPLE